MGKYRYRRNTAALFLAVLLTVSRTESFPLLQSKKATRIPPGSNSNSNASSATFFRRRQGARGTVCLANDDNNDNLAASSQRNLIFKAYTRYLSLCELQPVVTKSLTAGLLAVVGDAVSQSLFLPSAPAKFDWIRCRTFFFVAVLFEGPWIHHWYNGLWKLGRWVQAVAAHGPADTTTRNIIVNQQQRVAVLAQVVVDQTVGVALFFPAYFVVYECVHAVVSGRGMYTALRLFQRSKLTSYLISLTFSSRLGQGVPSVPIRSSSRVVDPIQGMARCELHQLFLRARATPQRSE